MQPNASIFGLVSFENCDLGTRVASTVQILFDSFPRLLSDRGVKWLADFESCFFEEQFLFGEYKL